MARQKDQGKRVNRQTGGKYLDTEWFMASRVKSSNPNEIIATDDV